MKRPAPMSATIDIGTARALGRASPARGPSAAGALPPPRWPAPAPDGADAGRRRRSSSSIMLADDAKVQDLNRRFRGIDKPTNVLSFPAGTMRRGPPARRVMLGDVAHRLRDLRCAKPRAKANRWPTISSIWWSMACCICAAMIMSAIDDAEVMEALEAAILAGLGVADPYAS